MFDDDELYDPQEIADRKVRATEIGRADAMQFRADLAFILSTETGRRFFDSIRAMSRADLPSFNVDPSIAAWNEGRRSIDLDLTKIVSGPEFQTAYQQLLKESHDRHCKRAAYIAG